jgi:hypothetical protein
LREPVNQAYQNTLKDWAVIDPRRDAKTLYWYRRFADQAFAGVPPRESPGAVDDIRDFFPTNRRRKTLLIKEVNPLAADFFVSQYAPRVVFILRHPAAVADSFSRMGWLGGSFDGFSNNYGAILSQAIEATNRGWHKIVKYEDLARDPMPQYSELFASLELRPPVDYENIIHKYCQNTTKDLDPYNIQRSSLDEIDKWRQNLDQTQIRDVMDGYSRSGLNYYSEEI